MPSSNPARPFNEKDLILLTNGSPMFPLAPGVQVGQLGQDPATGVITSTGAAVNNVTTATPFATGALQADTVSRALLGSLAGRVLLVHAVAAGFLMPSNTPKIGTPDVMTVAGTATVPPAAATFPGVPLIAGEVKSLIMLSTHGWLQWISSSGTASLVVWELF